jgi:hypothetical protein
MGGISIKDIKIYRIDRKTANEFVQAHHYSGKVCQNSNLHFGCFYEDYLHGVLSFGSPLDKRKVIGLVKNTRWYDFIELNRMAFDDFLPKNSESRCIAIAIRLIKKHCPHIRWILSFADGTQCGDGTIYRASGFVLTGINPNKSIMVMPDGEKIVQTSLTANVTQKKCREIALKYGLPLDGSTSLKKYFEIGAKKMEGYQLRYIYLIDKKAELSVPVLPFEKIKEMGAKMYKGEKMN